MNYINKKESTKKGLNNQQIKSQLELPFKCSNESNIHEAKVISITIMREKSKIEMINKIVSSTPSF